MPKAVDAEAHLPEQLRVKTDTAYIVKKIVIEKGVACPQNTSDSLVASADWLSIVEIVNGQSRSDKIERADDAINPRPIARSANETE